MSKLQFEIFQTPKEYFTWHLKSANDELIATGQTYFTRQGAVDAVHAVMSTTRETKVTVIPRKD